MTIPRNLSQSLYGFKHHFDGKGARPVSQAGLLFVAAMNFKKVTAGVQLPVHQQVNQALQHRIPILAN